MPAVSSIIAGGSALLGAGASIIGGNKAAKATKDAARQSAEVERYMYDQTRADQEPYRVVGGNALYKLADLYGVSRPVGAAANDTGTVTSVPPSSGGFGSIGDLFRGGGGVASGGAAPARQMTPGYDGFQASPGYEFRLTEGVKAAERSAAARGLLGSGATMKAIQRYGEGLASSEYENYANRLAALAGVGQTSTQATSQAGQAAANGMSQAFTNAGNARASAYANTGAAINSGAQNLASLYLYQNNGGFGAPSAYGIKGSGGIY